MIVDLDRPPSKHEARAGRLMAAATTVAIVGLAAIVLRAPDPGAAARSRERLLPAGAPTVAPTLAPTFDARLHRPSILAQVTPAPSLPPPLTLAPDLATMVVATSGEAQGEVVFAPSDRSRPLVYRLADGRFFVVQQMALARGRPLIASYGLQEGIVRGRSAELINSSYGPIRSLVWWEEPDATYYVYSRTLTVPELVRLARSLE